MKALTVHQPWAGLIATGQKDVENRTWLPPLELVGSRIAIHAGKDSPLDWTMFGDFEYDELCRVNGVIIATVRLADVIDDSTSRWAVPKHYHWMLDDPQPLAKPVHTRGKMRLWDYPLLAEPRRRR